MFYATELYLMALLALLAVWAALFALMTREAGLTRCCSPANSAVAMSVPCSGFFLEEEHAEICRVNALCADDFNLNRAA
jgi:hypothetical protein